MNKENQEIKTPLSAMLDMAKIEIGEHVESCMNANHIPPEMMMMVLKDILLDLSIAKNNRLLNEFINMQKNFKIEDANKEE